MQYIYAKIYQKNLNSLERWQQLNNVLCVFTSDTFSS